MKARITKYEDTYQIMFCNGNFIEYNIEGMKEFIKEFDNPSHYKLSQKLLFKINFDNMDGDEVAYISDKLELCVVNSNLFSEILEYKKFNYISVQDYAKKHNKSESGVKHHCRKDHIPGVHNIGSTWLIPEDAPYPEEKPGMPPRDRRQK